MRASLKITALLLMSACFVNPWGCAGKKQPKETDMQKSLVTASLGVNFQLKHNQTAVIESENLSVEFMNVAEDSRCPVGVECIWAGQAKIELEIKQKDKEPENIVLTSIAGQDELAVTQIEDNFIKLIKVEPPRIKDIELKLSDYNITLMVSRNIENLSQQEHFTGKSTALSY